MVRVYTRTNCMQCKFTKRKLDEINVTYEEINIDEVPEALEHVKELGFKSVPVVETENDTWNGFRPNKLATLSRA